MGSISKLFEVWRKSMPLKLYVVYQSMIGNQITWFWVFFPIKMKLGKVGYCNPIEATALQILVA
jgi:hypothetical protein